ncbi:coenzyme F420 hydrogenase subunit alpha [Methanocella sp. CWC-04]|uniref:Coenzyme F420 hydrogenase subunit alpha n=1 Tax=Methanooceanicella nereidis TaxID=2052831 RepID=A0AAP2RG31_9EURY|nr:coenzyme F420 hydrogenase subunit alpha [Methanocella sp. CWC-04]MCD1296136.1 coenzyme F420 hydrogenase subunit alpha [Methanocella sp. CWC-04]
MGKTVVIAPTTRNEGHGKFVLEVDDEGIVKKGHFMSLVLVRGFERFLVGRAMEFAPLATSRYCGLCPPTHATASSEAIERSLEISPPAAGRLLRELCNIGNHLHDHPLQQILVLPDYVKETQKQRECIIRIQRMRKIGQYICEVTGGEAIHSPFIRIGGMLKNINEPVKRKLLEQLKEFKKIADDQNEFMREAYDKSDVPKGLGDHDLDMMSTDIIYGRSEVYENEYHPGFSEVLPVDYHGEEIGVDASTVIPLINGKIIEVGPRARLKKYGKKIPDEYTKKGCVTINRARLKEIEIRIERGIEILQQLETTAPTITNPGVTGTGKLGIGVNEAPRGTNVHMAKVLDGRITWYKSIPATMWNIPVIGRASEGYHYKWAQWVMRAYDPCISCATHMVVINDGKIVDEQIVRPGFEGL